MKWFLFVMMFCTQAFSVERMRLSADVSVMYKKNGEMVREQHRLYSGKDLPLNVGNKDIECSASVSSFMGSGKIKNVTISCMDKKSGLETQALGDCDTGKDIALMLRTDIKKQPLPSIIINANCKTDPDKT